MPSSTMRSNSSRSVRVVERGDDEQHEVGARGARLEHLVRRRDEVLAQHGQRDRGADGLEVGERAAEPAALGEHADRARAAELVAARRARPGRRCRASAPRDGLDALDLGDDLDAVGRAAAPRGRRAPPGARAPRARPRRAARVSRRASESATAFAVSSASTRQCAFCGDLRAADAVAGAGQDPADDRADDAGAPPTPRRATARSKKNATVPIVKAMSMMMTAVHAAGECPWPGSACSVLMMLLRCGVSGPV